MDSTPWWAPLACGKILIPCFSVLGHFSVALDVNRIDGVAIFKWIGASSLENHFKKNQAEKKKTKKEKKRKK